MSRHVKILYFLSKIGKIRAKSQKKWLQVHSELTPHFRPLWFDYLLIGFNTFRLKAGRNVWSAPACLALGPMPHMARINRQASKAVRLC